MKKPTPLTTKWPCVFAQPDIKAVDKTVQELWIETFGRKPNFGDLRNQWRRHHCRTLNPYGSESCPYTYASCARSFLEAAEVTAAAKARVPTPYFGKVAKTTAAKRADEKPLNRGLTPSVSSATFTRTGVLDEERPGHAGTPAENTEERPRLRSGEDRPFSIGDVLRSLDLRPHQRPPDDGETSTE